MINFRQLFTVLIVFLFVSCTQNTDSGSPPSNNADSNIQNWVYDDSSSMFEVERNTNKLSIYVTEPVNIYMAKMNPSEYVIPANKTRYVTDASFSPGSNRSVIETRPLENLEFSNTTNSISEDIIFERIDFIPAQTFSELHSISQSNSFAMARNSSSTAETPVSRIDPVVGVTTKNIYLNYDIEEERIPKQATLRAAGSYCYVWIVDSYYSETAANDKVSTVTANTIQQKFDAMYPIIRNVFGNEAEYMVNSNGIITNIYNISNTGEKINIVIYDIDKDFEPQQTSGTFGFFWAKDYYESYTEKNINISNKGKYFYIDSYFVNNAINIYFQHLPMSFNI